MSRRSSRLPFNNRDAFAQLVEIPVPGITQILRYAEVILLQLTIDIDVKKPRDPSWYDYYKRKQENLNDLMKDYLNHDHTTEPKQYYQTLESLSLAFAKSIQTQETMRLNYTIQNLLTDRRNPSLESKINRCSKQMTQFLQAYENQRAHITDLATIRDNLQGRMMAACEASPPLRTPKPPRMQSQVISTPTPRLNSYATPENSKLTPAVKRAASASALRYTQRRTAEQRQRARQIATQKLHNQNTTRMKLDL